jgi:hypothetical protein
MWQVSGGWTVIGEAGYWGNGRTLVEWPLRLPSSSCIVFFIYNNRTTRGNCGILWTLFIVWATIQTSYFLGHGQIAAH